MHKVFTFNEHILKEGTNESEVKCFYVDGNNQLIGQSTYSPATLYKTTSKDEDGKQITEYTEKQGRKVMERRGTSDYADTYYVYNDLGQQAYVLPPLAADALGSGIYSETTDAVKKYGYVYKYDESGNCKYKKLPGCEPIYMVYDKADRLILSQDGNQRARIPASQWTVTKYDVFGRVLYTGIMPGDTNKDYATLLKNIVITETYNGSGNTGYSEQDYGVFTTITPLTVNYYDNYDFIEDEELNYVDMTEDGYSSKYTPTSGNGRSGAIGLLTGTRTYLLDGSGAYTASAMYYDDKGRVVQTRAKNHLGGFDITYNALDFTGKPLKTYKTHGIQGLWDSTKELYTYAYDQAQRLLTIMHQLNGGSSITLATNTYDELGRAKTKTVGGTLDATNYSYNIRNWLTSISGSRFYEDFVL